MDKGGRCDELFDRAVFRMPFDDATFIRDFCVPGVHLHHERLLRPFEKVVQYTEHKEKESSVIMFDS